MKMIYFHRFITAEGYKLAEYEREREVFSIKCMYPYDTLYHYPGRCKNTVMRQTCKSRQIAVLLKLPARTQTPRARWLPIKSH